MEALDGMNVKAALDGMKVKATLWVKKNVHQRAGAKPKRIGLGGGLRGRDDVSRGEEEEKEELRVGALDRIWRNAGTSRGSVSKRTPLPPPLEGGVVVDAEYEGLNGESLCRSIFESFDEDTSLLPRAYSALQRTDIDIGEWKCDEEKEICTRSVSYTAPPSGSVKTEYESYETQTIRSPAPGVCLVNSMVSTPSVRFGKTFKTSVQYVITRADRDNELEQGEGKRTRSACGCADGADKMNVSFDVEWTGRKPLLAVPIKRAITRAIYTNFGIFVSGFPTKDRTTRC